MIVSGSTPWHFEPVEGRGSRVGNLQSTKDGAVHRVSHVECTNDGVKWGYIYCLQKWETVLLFTPETEVTCKSCLNRYHGEIGKVMGT